MERPPPFYRIPNVVLDLILFHLLDPLEYPVGHPFRRHVTDGKHFSPRTLASKLSSESFSSISCFRLLGRRCNDVYRLRFYPCPPAFNYNLILDLVLYHLLEPIDQSFGHPFEGTAAARSPRTAEELSKQLSPASHSAVVAFRLLNRRCDGVYRLRFCPRPPIFNMPRKVCLLDKVLNGLLGVGGEPYSTTTEESLPLYLGISPSQLSLILQPNSLQDVLNFRLVSHRFNDTYKLRFGSRPYILSLPEEVQKTILEYHVHMKANGKIMPTEKKASLSVESFALQQPPPEDTHKTAAFRLVCREFADRALVCQFTRISIRFSDDFCEEGLERLKRLGAKPELANTVKQLSYLVPRFYSHDSDRIEEILQSTRNTSARLQEQLVEKQQNEDFSSRPTLTQLKSRLSRSKDHEDIVAKAMFKARQQKKIIEGQKDLEGLLFVLTKFRNLEQIRFMKIVDRVDEGWLKFLGSHPEYATGLGHFEWNRACEHSARTLTRALIQSNSQSVNRLSSRFIDPITPLSVSLSSRIAIANVARRLSSLELEFDNRLNLDQKIEELSEVFRHVFSETTSNLQNLHVGFRRLVSVPLKTVFHDIRLEKLNYLGLHQWEVECEELIDLLLRHRNIKYLRLRYICLKRGSWAKVLRAIRLNLNLSWISLRGISYPSNSELGGMNFAPWPHGPLSDDSDEDSDIDDEWSGSDTESSTDEEPADMSTIESDHSHHIPSSDNNHSEGSEDGNDDASDDAESVLGDTSILPSHVDDRQPLRRPSFPGKCYCYSGFAWDAVNHSKAMVQAHQWKFWQQWLLKPCPEHDPESVEDDMDSDSD